MTSRLGRMTVLAAVGACLWASPAHADVTGSFESQAQEIWAEVKRQKPPLFSPIPPTMAAALGDAMTCPEKLAYIKAHSKWCDGTGWFARKVCTNRNDVELIDKMYPKCAEQVKRFEGKK